MIKYATDGKESFKGKRVVISGSGNVAQYAALKAKELGATIVSLSDSQGSLIATTDAGLTPEQVEIVQQLKVERKPLSDLAQHESFKQTFEYKAGVRPWTHVGKVDIALPSATQNEVSGEEAKALIEAGKHVLCEKPFSLDAAAAREAVEKARENGLALMEGFMYRFHPQTARLREILDSGAIGEVRQVVAEFGHRLNDPEDVRGAGSLGGGSLGDVGCYCVSGLRLAFGSEPVRATAFGRFDDEGADRDIGGVLEFEGGVGLISCSISSSRRERLEIVGTDGRITLHTPFRADKIGGEMEVHYGIKPENESFQGGDPYKEELEEFARAIHEGRDPAVGPDEILGNARAIDALLRSARAGGAPQEV